MKHIYQILIITLLVASCSEGKKNTVESALDSNNVETMRQKRGELVNSQQALNDQIKLLDEKIKTMDTTKFPFDYHLKNNTKVFATTSGASR